ncbi:MAG: hypothetical protein AB7K24_22190 [Gemmataceae bacterium]
MNRPARARFRRVRRALTGGIVLAAYLLATLVPATWAVPTATPSSIAPETPKEAKPASPACGCDSPASCCCAPQPVCSKPCCAPKADHAPQAPGLALNPLSCRCSGTNVWITVGSVLPVPPPVTWQPFFLASDWVEQEQPGRVSMTLLPPVPPPRCTS